MGNLVGSEDKGRVQRERLEEEERQKRQQPKHEESSEPTTTAVRKLEVAEQLEHLSISAAAHAQKDVSGDSAGRRTTVSEGKETDELDDASLEAMLVEIESDDRIPMVFRWDGGGKNVYITGTFNRWSEKIPMRRSGNEFLYIRELKRGKHAYKFIVDDEWRFAPTQPTVADPQGYINNFVDLTDFTPTFGSDMKALDNKDHITDGSLYGSFHPDPQDPQWYAKEPPPLPPHLRHIILNTQQPNDMTLAAKAIQIPQHVTLNHLYCSAIKENLMVLGITQRYRGKFVTTVFYSPLPDAKMVGNAAAAAEKVRQQNEGLGNEK